MHWVGSARKLYSDRVLSLRNRMPQIRMERRRAIALLGAVGVGAILAGCTDDDDGGEDDDNGGGGPY